MTAESSTGRTTGRLPDFLIVGAPRSGTMALTQYLRGHAMVFMPLRKELNFFDRSDPSGSRLDWYRRQFAGARPDQVAGEATPTYLFSEQAPARMAAAVPDARLIALLRDPVERAYSHYWLCRLWQLEHREFAEAVRDELAGRSTPGLEYLAHGRYLEEITRMLDHFPRRSLLVLVFDDLVANPESSFAKACQHIGVDDTVVPPIVGKRINTTQRPRSLRLWRALERWRTSGRKGLALAGFISSKNAVPFEPPPMEAGMRCLLVEHFAEPNAALGKWLGRNLSCWHAES